MLDLLFASFLLSSPQNLTSDFSLSHAISGVASLPVNLTNTSAPDLSAQSAYVFDMDSATVIFEKASNEILPIASLTKLMTGLISAQNLNENQKIVVPKESRTQEILLTKTLGLPVGGEFSVGEILGAMLISSSADAAATLAYNVSGSQQNFVQNMNTTARELDLQRTNFDDTFGLSTGNLSTAENLSRLFSYTWRNQILQKYLSQKEIKLCLENSKLCYTATTTNLLLGKDGVIGGKTGTTDAAGECIILAVKTPLNKTILITLLNSSDRFGDSKKILSWLQNNFKI